MSDVPCQDDLDDLAAALHERWIDAGAEPVNGLSAWAWACCVAALHGPDEVVQTSPVPEDVTRAAVVLRDVEASAPPEAELCRRWLAILEGDAPTVGDDDQFEVLASGCLWEPVRALAYRVLGWRGRRLALARVLPAQGPLSLAMADAWHEALQSGPLDPQRLDEAVPDDALLPPDLRAAWRCLLLAESAAERADAALLAELASITATSGPYAHVVAQRVASRAAAALLRARIGSGQGIGGDDGAAGLLPSWERAYLDGLGRWRLDDVTGALDLLTRALDASPAQSAPRQALAVLRAPDDPSAALDLLAPAEASGEVIVARAMLLARLGAYDEAAKMLRPFDDTAPAVVEPTRYSWPRGRAQIWEQARRLQMALAEHQQDWVAAARFRQVEAARGRRTLAAARGLFAAAREEHALPPGGWRQRVLRQRLDREIQTFGQAPLTGTDAFFRAVGTLAVSPDRAVKDARSLVRRRAWLARERAAGGGRIVGAADILLRHGLPEEATQVYEATSDRTDPLLAERLAVAQVFAGVRHGSPPGPLRKAAERASELAPRSPWPHLLAALGLLIRSRADLASHCLDDAESRGAPAAIVRCLRALVAEPGTGPAVSDDDVAAAELPPQIDALVRLVSGAGSEEDRLLAYTRAVGGTWPTQSVVDEHMARRCLLALGRRGSWDDALGLAGTLDRYAGWAGELAALVRLWQALDEALQGRLEEAERALYRLDHDLALRPPATPSTVVTE